jgi:hypothetical protein
MPIRRSPNGAAHTSPQTDRDRPEWVIGIIGIFEVELGRLRDGATDMSATQLKPG